MQYEMSGEVTITAYDITRRHQYNWIPYIAQNIEKNVAVQ
jgi:hypothetical protein